MFGSNRRSIKNRLKSTNVSVRCNHEHTSDALYYKLYSEELTKRILIQRRMFRARRFVEGSNIIPKSAKRTLLAILK